MVGGGGGARRDCLVVFDAPVNFPPERPAHIRCTDGDACDADGSINGVCRFPVAICANSTFDPRCSANGVDDVFVDHALDNGDPRFDPEFQALQTRVDSAIAPPSTAVDRCTNPVNIHVVVRGPLRRNRCARGRKTIRLISDSIIVAGLEFLDRDQLRIVCEPAVCDPQLFFTGSFDRIQRQIFNPSCATGGCHDSQSQTGGMLLEEAGSYTNLVDVLPTNGPAAAAGWRRVTPGNVETSFLFRKLTGDLEAGMGGRMPQTGPRVPGYLRDLVELWIAAGAPESGWVPGTF